MISARAVRIREPGNVSVLEIVDTKVRPPWRGELLIEVAAAGLNRADVLQRKGRYPAPAGSPQDIPGLEYAGRVAAVGEGVSKTRIGERVMGIVGGGAMCTELVVHERETIPIPPGLTDEEAAAIPEAFVTAFDALVLQAGMTSGDQVLIHSVASGVGTAALQLALALKAIPTGTSRTAGKLEKCRSMGLTHGLVVKEGRFADEVRGLTNGAGVDLILDMVGAAYFDENIRALKTRGRMVLLGTMGGATGPASLGAWMAKRATVIGTVLRSRPLEEKIELARRFTSEVVPLFDSGRLKPVIDAVLPFDRVREAHERMERDETFGKLVMSWSR